MFIYPHHERICLVFTSKIRITHVQLQRLVRLLQLLIRLLGCSTTCILVDSSEHLLLAYVKTIINFKVSLQQLATISLPAKIKMTFLLFQRMNINPFMPKGTFSMCYFSLFGMTGQLFIVGRRVRPMFNCALPWHFNKDTNVWFLNDQK